MPVRCLTAVLFLASIVPSLAAQSIRFREVVIDAEAAKKTCYAVVLADVDGDGDQDIVVVNENRVQWYANPDWKKHVIIEDQTVLDNVSIAPYDIDNDGKIDFALAAGWTKGGTIQWITRGELPEDKWSVHAIAIEPWTHRVRWGNVLGKERLQLVVSPLNATTEPGVRLTAFEIPDDPKKDRWPATVMDDTLDRMHNHWHLDFNGDGVESTITASHQGLHLFSLQGEGVFHRRMIGRGRPGDKPENSGAGEIKVGKLGNGKPFMATIEPMHGNMVAVYTMPGDSLGENELAHRLVIDESLGQGHAVWCANLDDDPEDEIVVGHRTQGTGESVKPGVYVYDALDKDGTKWAKIIVDDGGMACEDLLCADLNGDGKLDIVSVGRNTKNVKLYLNER